MRLFPRALFGALAVSACASPRAALPLELDPSNSEAAEAPLPPTSTTLLAEHTEAAPLFSSAFDAGAGTAPPPHAHESAAGPRAPDAGQAVLYTCPMHPEVVQGGPGRCPKCGMNLVLRKGGP